MKKNDGKTEAECALCRRVARLCNSHIISEFFYKTVYDEKHRFMKISTDTSKRIKPSPKGVYERLLCFTCERRLRGWETYASGVYREAVAHIQKNGQNFTINVVYPKFKLFAMSLLWRSGVSKRPEFAAVTLGKHEEILRRMLDTENPGQFYEYGVSIFFPPDPKAREVFGCAISSPQHERNGLHHIYRFMLGMTFWLFPVSSQMHKENPVIFSLHNDGTLKVRSGGEPTMEFLRRFSAEIAAANAKRPVAGAP